MEKTKKAFQTNDNTGFVLNFPNGNRLSTIYHYGAYCENHCKKDNITFDGNWESNSCEIMFDCSEELRLKILKIGGEPTDGPDGNILGWVDMEKWLEIFNLMSK